MGCFFINIFFKKPSIKGDKYVVKACIIYILILSRKDKPQAKSMGFIINKKLLYDLLFSYHQFDISGFIITAIA